MGPTLTPVDTSRDIVMDLNDYSINLVGDLPALAATIG